MDESMKAAAYRLGAFPVLILLLACGGASTASQTSSNSGSAVTKETLVWSDEFNGATAPSAPDAKNWTYDTGAGGWGNQELETYCAYGSATAPCDPKNPNAYVGTDGYLHIVARNPAAGVYTSARLKSQGLRSFQYGRIEARIKMPEGQGMWPAFWMLGDNITTVQWPASGEMDIMESIGKTPSTNYGSIHGTGFTGTAIGASYSLPNGEKFGDGFHTFGIIWSPKKLQYYVDSPTNVYATYIPANLPPGAVWPFDAGKFFFILNTAVGGAWPGPPDKTTIFPQQMLVDYVRVYAEPTF
jgi:beta-glucanase (GH16 family)